MSALEEGYSEPSWWGGYESLPPEKRDQLRVAAIPPLRLPKPYVRLTPTPKQGLLLTVRRREIFFGGAAGPGKSTGLLLAALRYVDVPGYSALLLRRTMPELKKQGSLIPKSKELLAGTPARWNANERNWTFPSGAVIEFGYLRQEDDVQQYQSAEYHFVGWDELTHFSEEQYLYVFSRQRRPSVSEQLATSWDGLTSADVPLQTMSASNPGGPGHEWVKARFVDHETREPGALFIPAVMQENEHLDRAGYLESLGLLRGATRRRLEQGDWDAVDDGDYFTRKSWFVETPDPRAPMPDRMLWSRGDRAVRAWDLASTKVSAQNSNPDWTVGLREEIDESTGEYCVVDIKRDRWSPGDVEDAVYQTAVEDGHSVPILMPQDPGQAGKALAERYRRHVLRGFNVIIRPVTGDKKVRATPVSAAAEHRLVGVIKASWNSAFFAELEVFPVGHDDQVDALSDAHRYLASKQEGGVSSPDDEPPTTEADAAISSPDDEESGLYQYG